MVRAFAGSNFYLIKRYTDKIKNDFIAKNGEMSVEEIDAEEAEIQTVINALQTTSLFTENKLIILKNIAKNKILSEKIEKIIAIAESGNDLVIVERAIDKRNAYYKYLKKNSNFTDYGELDEGQLVEWLREEAREAGASLSKPDARYLVNRIGLDQSLLHNELQKLIAFDPEITRENINLLTSEKPQSSIFNLLDAAFAGNSALALKIYEEQKIQGSAPQSIFGMLVWQANIIATVASGRNMSTSEISTATGLKPFSINKAVHIYQKAGYSGVNSLLDKLVEADKQMKTQSTNPDEVLRNLLVAIS